MSLRRADTQHYDERFGDKVKGQNAYMAKYCTQTQSWCATNFDEERENLVTSLRS